MTDHWHTIGVVVLIALCALLVHTMAVRGEEPHSHMGAAGEFYAKWMRPQGPYSNAIGHRKQSCCNRTDCSAVIETQMRNGQMFARFELAPATWYQVYPDIIESNQTDPRESPDHRAHGCVIGGQVVCYVEGGGT